MVAGSWPDAADLPSAACIVKDHAAIDAEVADIEAALQRDLQTSLWKPGGESVEGADGRA